MKIPAILPVALLAAAIVFASPVNYARAQAQCPAGMMDDPDNPGTCICETGTIPDPADSTMCIADPNPAPTNPDSGNESSSSSSSNGSKTTGAQRFALGAGILILAGGAFGVWENIGDSPFLLSPIADADADGVFTSRGARLDYRGNDWTLWWSAEGIRRAEDAATESRLGWGGEWQMDDNIRLDAAALITDETTDFRAGAGAALDFHGWVLRPSWRVRAEALETGWDSRMDADLAAEWTRLGWSVRPSVGATGSLRNVQADGAFMRVRVERTLGW